MSSNLRQTYLYRLRVFWGKHYWYLLSWTYLLFLKSHCSLIFPLIACRLLIYHNHQGSLFCLPQQEVSSYLATLWLRRHQIICFCTWRLLIYLEERPFYAQNIWCLLILLYHLPPVIIVQIILLQRYSMHICTLGPALGVCIIESLLCLYLALNLITQSVLLFWRYQFCLSSVRPLPL